ncbi:MAG: asparagine synthase (glutamine-hydrolyzing) [Candidatus Omnitrophota bacterium]|jgi:asparagine synthase (glutamine-hydrolysing)
MCGICGYIHLDVSKKPSESILKNMVESLRRRGPDDAGFYLKDNVALGHRRLSIIDLKTGHQPMSSESAATTIVYNGEIYNFGDLKAGMAERAHEFKTYSDTEVMIHAYEEYGEDCVKLFNGMFAFAIWDSRKKKLFIARDRFGKKPLYYGIFDNQFIFGSELKSLLKHPSVRKIIDFEALGKYLAYEYIPAPYSIFKGIFKLEAGSKLILENGKVKVDRYWTPRIEPDNRIDVKTAEVRLVQLLKESVRKRLISDVPLGVFLSGGIDSSAVVAMMSELMKPKDIKTFSVGFKEKSYDESSDARRVAEHFHTDHHEEILDPDAMLEVFPDILEYLDEPFADSSIIPTYLVSKFTRKHVTVALGGDGGDELFMGYPSFMGHKLDEYFRFCPSLLKKIILNGAAMILPDSQRHMNLASYVHRFAIGAAYPESVRHQVWIGSFTPPEEDKLFLPGVNRPQDIFNIYDLTDKFYHEAEGPDALNRAMYVHINTYMTDDILVKVDRASMANSLEVRAPFLDVEFAEYAMRIPSSLKLRGSNAKWILKEAFKNRLPPSTLAKGKRGFAVPVTKWLKGDLQPMLLNAFSKSKIEREGIFDYAYINDIMCSFLSGKVDVRKKIWALFMFEMWYDKWM